MSVSVLTTEHSQERRKVFFFFISIAARSKNAFSFSFKRSLLRIFSSLQRKATNMDRYPVTDMTPLPKKNFDNVEYGRAFLAIHLDERFNAGEDFQFFYTSRDEHGNIYVDLNKRIFHDADQCIDFISSYE